MKLKHYLFSLGVVILFLIIMSIWGDIIMLLHPGRFMKSGWDEGLPIEKYSLNGIITGFDEGRGLKIWVDNSDTMLRVKGIMPIDSNAKHSSYPYLTYGDSIIKSAENDTFKIIRHDTLFT